MGTTQFLLRWHHEQPGETMKSFKHAVPPTTTSVDSCASGNAAAHNGTNQSTLKARQKLGFDGAGPAVRPGRAHCPISLELLVAEQAKAVERLSRLKLFFPPQLV